MRRLAVAENAGSNPEFGQRVGGCQGSAPASLARFTLLLASPKMDFSWRIPLQPWPNLRSGYGTWARLPKCEMFWRDRPLAELSETSRLCLPLDADKADVRVLCVRRLCVRTAQTLPYVPDSAVETYRCAHGVSMLCVRRLCVRTAQTLPYVLESAVETYRCAYAASVF